MSETKENTGIVKREEKGLERTRQLPVISPMVDIYENDEEILLYTEMPGVAKENVTINLENGTLELSGIRKLSTNGSVQWEEFGHVEYQRKFSVPQTIDTAKVNAELKEGVLRLHLPKSEAAKPRQIEINAA